MMSSSNSLSSDDEGSGNDDSDIEIIMEDTAVASRELTEEEKRETVVVDKPSVIWKFIRKLKYGPRKNAEGKPTSYVCQLCLDSGKNLQSCLIMLYKDKTSNGAHHLKAHHQRVYDAAKLAAKPNQDDPSIQSPVASLVCVQDKGAPLSEVSGLASTHSQVTCLDAFLKRGHDNCLNAVHLQLVRVVANHHLPLSFSQADDVTLLLNLASKLKAGSYETLTRACQDRVLLQLFDMFLLTIKGIIKNAKDVYSTPSNYRSKLIEAGMKPPGWVTVMHDGWDSTQRSMFGTSVSFIDPRTWNLVKVAVGLGCPISHKAKDCADTAFEILSRVGIHKSDILFSVNDTTNASMATGLLLQNGKDDEDDDEYGSGNSTRPTCRMHVSSLAIEHACGKRQRTQNKNVVDSFEAFENLRLKHRKCVNHIFRSGGKQRYKNYCDRNATVQQSVIRVSLDNDTRIGGTLRLFQEQLRVRFCEKTYFGEEPDEVRNKFCITDDEWELTAQLEAVVRGPVGLNFSTQVDNRPTIGTSWLYAVRAKLACRKEEYSIVNVKPTQTDAIKKWDASWTFELLPMIKKNIEHMRDEAKTLRTRLQNEFDRYFPEPDDNQLIGMMVDPVMFTAGQKFLVDVGDLVGQDQAVLVDKAMAAFVGKVHDEAKRADMLATIRSAELDQSREVSGGGKMGKGGSSLDRDETSDVDDDDDDDDEIFARVREKRKHSESTQIEVLMESTIDKLSPTQVADEELSRWKELVINWKQVLTQQVPPLEKLNYKKIQESNPFYLAEVVDVLAWWRQNAEKFPLISRVAQRYLALPDANGFQERAFSCAKFVDHSLRQRLSHIKFEMLALLAFNKSFIEENCNPLILKSIADSMDHAPSASAATDRLIDFFAAEGSVEEEAMRGLLACNNDGGNKNNSGRHSKQPRAGESTSNRSNKKQALKRATI